MSNLDIVTDSEVISVNRDIRDHDATLINIKIPCLLKRSYMRKVWLYKKADFNKINNEILKFQWEQFLHKGTDIEDLSNRFTHKCLEMFGRGMPSRLVRIRLNSKPWFNSEIIYVYCVMLMLCLMCLVNFMFNVPCYLSA